MCAATGNRLGHIEIDTGGIRVFGSTITGEPEKISGIKGEHDNEAFRWCTNDSSVIISRAGPQCVSTTGLSLSLCFVGLNVYCFCWADRIRIARLIAMFSNSQFHAVESTEEDDGLLSWRGLPRGDAPG